MDRRRRLHTLRNDARSDLELTWLPRHDDLVGSLPLRFVGAMSGPRGGWPVASLEIGLSGEVVLQARMGKLQPPPMRWLQGTVVRADHVRGIVTTREGVRLRGRYGMRAIFWCHNPREVLAALSDAGVPATLTERPVRTWRRFG
jgi:hypothetical protein